jgi:16S rRNA (uracil1498-N3)-methyltransferase
MTSHKRRVTRLFVDHALDGDILSLDEDEAHYLGHVLRLQRGDELIAFNGRGGERHALVGALQRRGATLELRADHPALPESSLDLTLLQALPKADAMDLIVQKATELGAKTVAPAYSEFTVVRIDDERLDRRVDHWRRIARSACEQCGRHTPPAILAPVTLNEGLRAVPADSAKLVLDPGATTPLRMVQKPTAGLVVAIGPEGGFAPNDWRLLDAAGFSRVTLGPRVLRAETAAIATCTIAQAQWGDLGS